MSDPNAHQRQQPFPQLDAPIGTAEIDGKSIPVVLDSAWYFLIIRLWQVVFGQTNITAPAFIAGLDDFPDDVAAAAGGVAITGLYRTGSIVKVRVA